MTTRQLDPLAPRGLALATLFVGAFVCLLPLFAAAQDSGRSTTSWRQIERDIESREELQTLYKKLYETQLQLRKSRDDSALRDSLVLERQDLIAEIESLHAELEPSPPRPPRPSGFGEGGELGDLVDQLEGLGEGIDLSEIVEIFEENAQNWGEGLSALGEQLQGLEVDIDGSRVRIQNDSGARFRMTIPEELREDISEGIREVGEELNRVLSDSSKEGFGRELRVLLDELPSDTTRDWFGREKSRKRKVIAQSIFRFFEDVEIADDEMVSGDVILIGSDAYVAGEIQGNCYLLFGDLFVEQEGSVGKDAVSLGGRVTLDDDSVVHGRMFDMGSVVPGLGLGSWSGSDGFAWMIHWVRVAVLALLLLLGYAVVGDRLQPMAAHSQRFLGRDLGSGALWFAIVLGGVTLASVGLVISVIGIPVVVVLLAAFSIALMLAYFVGCQVIGARLLSVVGGAPSLRDARTALIGLAVLEVPALLALGFQAASGLSGASPLLQGLDWLLKLLVLFLGFGALVATRVGGREEEPIPAETLPSALVD